jgi:hypothetical protein
MVVVWRSLLRVSFCSGGQVSGPQIRYCGSTRNVGHKVMKSKELKYIVIIWASIVLFFELLGWNSIWNHSVRFHTIKNVITFFSWIIIPILAILLIKRQILRYVILTIYSVILILLAFPLTFVGFFLINDLKTNNGFQKIHEQALNENEKFVIYLTPDKGALGGLNRIFTIDRELIWGFHKRKRLKPGDYKLIQSREPSVDTIFYRNDTIVIDYTEK